MKRVTQFLGIALALALPAIAHAQQWSPEQKEVWTTVEGIWRAWAAEDVDGQFRYIDDAYRGWGSTTPFPFTNTDARKWNQHWAANNAVVLYTIHPVAIDIHGDVAIAFYSYMILTADKNGNEMQEMGRWGDVYKKKDGRWLLVSDFLLQREIGS